MIISPPPQESASGEPGTPPALAAATAAAHEAAAIAAEAELRRTGGSVTQTRGPGAGTRPTIQPGLRPPTAPRASVGQEFISANAAAARGATFHGDGVIEGTVAGVGDVDAAGIKRQFQKRRRVALIVFLALAVIVLLVGQLMRNDDNKTTSSVSIEPAASALAPNAGVAAPAAGDVTRRGAAANPGATTGQAPADAGDTAPTRLAAGTANGFTFVGGYGPVLGTAGTLRRFKVAVQKNIGQGDGAEFSDEVDRILGDPRSWVAGGQYRLQRVPQSAASEFTIYLAAARTSERMCAQGGLQTDGFTSCRLPGQVIINMDRWENSVPDYRAPLATYRAYAINHEVGHQLGHGHEACPGKGRAAPVMMQQTYGLNGCVANSWPYVGGKRYAGGPTA